MGTATTLPTTAPPIVAPATIADLLRQLGGINPSRVRLAPPLGTATEADLIAINRAKQGIYELVDGLLVQKVMGYPESLFTMFLAGLLNHFVIPHNLGIVSGPDGMMRLFPGLIREPDLAFASWDRVPGGKMPTTPIAGFAPDLAIEVLSRGNTRREMARKRAEYFAAGVRLVWEIDPKKRTVAVYTVPEGPTVLDATMTLDGGAVLPGFVLPLTDLFAYLDRHG